MTILWSDRMSYFDEKTAGSLRRLKRAVQLSTLALLPCLATPVLAAWVDTGTKILPHSAATLLGTAPATMPMHILVGLNLQNVTELSQLESSIRTPGNPAYGSALTPAQFTASYAVSPAQAQIVADYLSGLGFTNVSIASNRLYIAADATAAKVQAAFNTPIMTYALSGAFAGQTVYMNSQTAQVPDSLGGVVSSIVGLSNLSTTKTQIKHASKTLVKGAQAVPNAGTPVLEPVLNAAAYQTAYDAGSYATGSQTSIGIIMEGDLTSVMPDLLQYEKENSLPNVPVVVVPTGVGSTDASGVDEWDLDSQTSLGIAGNFKQEIWYDADSLSDPDLIPAYNKAVTDNVAKAINVSLGGCETLEYLNGGMLLADEVFRQAAVQGQTFHVSSGDAGAACSVLINLGLPDTGLPDVEYPASSPYVLGVGGTSLFVDSTNAYVQEIAWDGGGGGTSLWETAPLWQEGIDLVDTTIPVAGINAALRGVPDIAMDADNNLSPATIVVGGADTGVGGTSLASPLSVGVEARFQSANCNGFTFTAPIYYTYATGAASGGVPAVAAFHDIIVGTNGAFTALPGWDFTTGLGTFDITAVAAKLPLPMCTSGTTTGGTTTGGSTTGGSTTGGSTTGGTTTGGTSTGGGGTSSSTVASPAAPDNRLDGGPVAPLSLGALVLAAAYRRRRHRKT
jgi:subtilase family serine protease